MRTLIYDNIRTQSHRIVRNSMNILHNKQIHTYADTSFIHLLNGNRIRIGVLDHRASDTNTKCNTYSNTLVRPVKIIRIDVLCVCTLILLVDVSMRQCYGSIQLNGGNRQTDSRKFIISFSCVGRYFTLVQLKSFQFIPFYSFSSH